MALEGLSLAEQLPKEVTRDLFMLLTSPRSGSEWLMTMLDQHPHVCASGESHRPESGYPTEAMLSQGMSWLPMCSIKKGCTLEFVLDGISNFTNSGATDPHLCQPGVQFEYTASNIDQHRQRICNFINVLDGNFTKENTLLKWTEAFVNEDKRFMG